jgi:formiminotetrahydrofolate cyclodeaminase
MTDAPLTTLSVRDLAERLASREPVPGGGSAAAIGGALGASLVGMVAELTIGRADAADREDVLREVRDAAATLRNELLDLAESDATAYDAVMTARRLPKTTDEERARRARQMHHTILEAARVPLETARRARDVLDLAVRIAPIGNRNAISDAGVAAQLASAAVRGAVLNVRINLPYLPADEPMRHEAAHEASMLEAAAVQREDEVISAVSLLLGAEESTRTA